MDGSNALILPCKRKNKAQGEAKSRKKSRQDAKIQLKKLQKLEEDKQKKLLQARSIEILRNHRISVDGYSLLHASGTIGQAETLKEKLRQAAQFSRAGLVVPEELSLFNKDGYQKDSENSEASEESFPHKFVDPTDANECNRNLNDRKSKNVIENDAMKPVECERVVDVEMSIPGPKTEGTFDLSDMLANSTMEPSVPSCSHVAIDFQDEELIQGGAVVQECFNPPIVVPVSRPCEVKRTRRDLPIIMMEQEIMEAIYENSVVILCGETGCGKTTQVPQSDILLKRYSVIILDEAHERSFNTDKLIGMLSRVVKSRKNLHAEHQEKLRLGLINPEDVINQLKVVLMSATLQLKDFISNRSLFDVIPPALKVPVRQFPVTVHFSKRTHDDYLGDAYKKVVSIHKRLPRGGILVFVTGQQEVDYLCKKLQRASKQQTGRKPEKVEGDESNSSPEVDEKEIYEAYDDMFSTYEEDEINSGPNVYSSDIVIEGEMDTDSEDDVSNTCETREEDGSVSEFLGSAEGSSALKAFKAISRGPGVPESVEKSSDATSLEQSIPSVPCFSKCTKPMSVSHVDTGKQKVKNYNHATGMASYEIQWISKASASQRAGRAGRTGPGDCYRLYSAAAYGKDELFPEFSEPEIKRVPVDGVVLMLRLMCINEHQLELRTIVPKPWKS